MKDNQLGRRNLDTWQRIKLIEACAAIKETQNRAKENQKLSEGRGAKRSVQMDKPFEPVDTRAEIAKAAGTSTGTVARYDAVVKHDKGLPEEEKLMPKVERNELTIGGAYQIARKANAPKLETDNDVRWRHAEFAEKAKSGEVVSVGEIRQEQEDRKDICRFLVRDMMNAFSKAETIEKTHDDFDRLIKEIHITQVNYLIAASEKAVRAITAIQEKLIDEKKSRE